MMAPLVPPSAPVHARRAWFAAAWVCAAVGGCSETLRLENLPAEVTSIGPLTRDGDDVLIAITAFEFEGDEAEIRVEWARDGESTFVPVQTRGPLRLDAVPLDRSRVTPFAVRWDVQADGLEAGTVIVVRAAGAASDQAPLVWGPAPLP
jgi:hypothetical protein